MSATPAAKPRTQFNSDTAREAARRSAEVRRAKKAERESGAATVAALTARLDGDLGSGTADALKAIAADTAQPGAVRVAAHRAVLDYLSKTRSLEDADRTLDAQTISRLRAWAAARVPIELGAQADAQTLEDGDVQGSMHAGMGAQAAPSSSGGAGG